MSSKQWFPLESNPDVMNSYVQKLGLNIEQFKFYDVMSTEDWALEMIPRPVVAVIMLYPIKESSEEHRREGLALYLI
jgi:ubiquitin carboxyl-terminal hydrolase L3